MAASGGKSMPEKQRRRLKTRPRTNLNGGDLVRCENLTTRHYKYLHKVRSALLASASNKNPKTHGNLDKRDSDSFHNQQGRYMQVM